MPRITRKSSRVVTDQATWDVDLPVLVSQMTCACAETAAYADAPMARTLFHRVEVMKQSPKLAARALGLRSGDAAYLLAGLREEVATDLVLLLLAERLPKEAAIENDSTNQ